MGSPCSKPENDIDLDHNTLMYRNKSEDSEEDNDEDINIERIKELENELKAAQEYCHKVNEKLKKKKNAFIKQESQIIFGKDIKKKVKDEKRDSQLIRMKTDTTRDDETLNKIENEFRNEITRLSLTPKTPILFPENHQ